MAVMNPSTIPGASSLTKAIVLRSLANTFARIRDGWLARMVQLAKMSVARVHIVGAFFE